MPVVLLRYKANRLNMKTMQMLTAALPKIFADALDVPENPGARLTPADIQIWPMKSDELDVNVKDLQMMMPLHAFPERIANLEERKDKIMHQVRELLADQVAFGGGPIEGWVWLLPSNDTAFGRL